MQAEELTRGDEILCSAVTGNELTYAKITNIRYIKKSTTVLQLFHVCRDPESYIASGIVTHNCYVARRKGFANPITTFVNIEQIRASIEKALE